MRHFLICINFRQLKKIQSHDNGVIVVIFWFVETLLNLGSRPDLALEKC